ncbi:serine protease SP24D-like [Episyrphus balteatus]|uniref:serine protease SP24D-like n=1 Tax=Episyrphus balteatus TaxID=286459 RepID=UPI0024866C10|nr:serine protease SP24D-like [Episyrphus balteatus]
MLFKTSLLVIFALVFCALVKAKPSLRIVGGSYAEIGQFSHQVALFRNGIYNCGGSIISSRYILTAAHCVIHDHGTEIYSPNEIIIRVGSMYRLTGGKLVAVKNIKVHEHYGNFLNDIALLELEETLTFSSNVQPIALSTDEVPNDAQVIISGWGRLYENGENAEWLKYNTVSRLDQADCQRQIGYGLDSIICLAHSANKGACMGDSGGPAVYNGKLVGISNFIMDVCGSSKPDAFGKVSYYLDWILSNMN